MLGCSTKTAVIDYNNKIIITLKEVKYITAVFLSVMSIVCTFTTRYFPPCTYSVIYIEYFQAQDQWTDSSELS